MESTRQRDLRQQASAWAALFLASCNYRFQEPPFSLASPRVRQGTAASWLYTLLRLFSLLWSLDPPSPGYAPSPSFRGHQLLLGHSRVASSGRLLLGRETRHPTVDTYFLRSTDPKRSFLPRTWSPAPRSRTGGPCGSGAPQDLGSQFSSAPADLPRNRLCLSAPSALLPAPPSGSSSPRPSDCNTASSVKLLVPKGTVRKGL